jgi:hypothetical protein
MKPQRFKPGQKVIKITPNKWRDTDTGKRSAFGPKFDEVVTVCEYVDNPNSSKRYITLREYPSYNGSPLSPAFNECGFEPLVEESVLEKELSEIPESVNA